MRALELWISDYLLNSLWQVPLLFVAAWVAARMIRSAGAAHRIWVGALVLEAVLPGFRVDLSRVDLFRMLRGVKSFLPWSWGGGVAGGHTHISFGAGTGSGAGVLWLPPVVLGSVVALYLGCVFYFAGRLAWGVWRTVLMRREAEPVRLTGEAARTWERLHEFFGLKRGVGGERIAVSPMIAGPVTVGIGRQVLLVPHGFLAEVSECELEAVLAHEFAHMRRRDFLKNLMYEALSVGVGYHPLLWMTRSRLAESREMVCDRMASEAVRRRERYVRSLLRLASMLSDRPPIRVLHAIGIFDANILERRVMNLTRRDSEVRGLRRVAVVAACVAIAAATCVSAMALRMEVSAGAAQDKTPRALAVPAGKMQDMILSKKSPVYPAEAKANKDTLDGPVVLMVIIGADGVPEKVLVKQSLRADYDRSALEAVREWRWKPYLLNGNPIEVKTTVTVNYNMAD